MFLGEQALELPSGDLSVRDDSVISDGSVLLDHEGAGLPVVEDQRRLPASDGKIYGVMLYNLDVIISVGYRVKSKNGIIFRKWASEILKDYLLKGYVVSSSRALIADENYINLINEVNGLKNNVNDSKKVPGSRIRNSFVCYEGKFYVGFVFINELIRSAKERVVIIDGYADNGVLDFFVGSKKGITKTVLCHKRERIELGILERFIKQYGQIIIKEDKSYHDRFLIIDNDVYLLGASLNSLGNKTSTITKTAQYKIEDIYKGE